jgi:tryptophanase
MKTAYKFSGHYENTKPTNHGYRRGGEFHSKGTENILSTITIENSPNMGREMLIQAQESFTTTEKHLSRSHHCPEMNMPEKQAARENMTVPFKGGPIRITADFFQL